MTTTEAPTATMQVETDIGQLTAIPVARSEYTPCATYKQAKYLAASRRRDGTDAYAIYVVALECWCVR